jgi:sodium-dependent dicarboxylate transporter 2/3/5
METRKKVGFILGPLLFIVAFFLPLMPGNPGAHKLLAVFLLIVVLWVTESLPIPVTALMIPVLITALGVTTAKEAFAPFANPIIMLFLGSFILAKGMCVHALDRKLAYSVLSLRYVRAKRIRILWALGLISAFLSLWISNTATTAMMYPIALGLIDAFRSRKGNDVQPFGTALLLTLAYAASIGGIGTPIGSPPNLIAIGMLEKLAGYKMTFFQWMVIGLLITLPMLVFLFLYMKIKTRRSEGFAGSGDLRDLLGGKPPAGLTPAQRNVLVAFSITVSLWVIPGVISLIWGRSAPAFIWLQAHFPEAAAAVIGACLLFILPVNLKRGQFTLTLKEAITVDWGTLLLFGGGLSLGFQMFETGLADAIGRYFISLGGSTAPAALITLLAISLTVFMTELTSNTASANMIIPIIIAISQAASINPLPPVLGSAIGCSFAFMLPVATPPNAIIYGSGHIPLPVMMRTGFWLNLAGIFFIWVGVTFLAPLLGLI